MLTCLRIQNLAIIESLEVEFGPQLNVITGETGAGKSILVDALDLVLGGRGNPDLVRTGKDQAEVEALFDLSDDQATKERLREAGIEVEGDELIVRRVVSAQRKDGGGRSRAYLNGSLTTAAQLASLAKGLVDISSQHEHHALIDPSVHLRYLDAFGQTEDLLKDYGVAFVAFDEARAAFRDARTKLQSKAEREEILRFQLRELEELAPKAGELASLAEERETLRHSQKLLHAAQQSEDILYGRDRSLCDELAHVVAMLSDASKFDARLVALSESVERARTDLEESAREIKHYARNLNEDPERLAEVEERLHRLQKLVRKYAFETSEDPSAALEEKLELLKQELALFDDQEGTLGALEKRQEETFRALAKIGKELSAKRTQASKDLGTSITAELHSLGMGGAKVNISVRPLEGAKEFEIDGARISETGLDRVEFLIAPNKGEEPKPLAKIASGGELSRAMLAIKRCLAGLGPSGLYIFDEVDSGVGGAIAEVIGRKIKQVAEHHQVICITHLAPIAVYANNHFLVKKEAVGERTESSIVPLSKQEQLDEVARMIGGISITKATRTMAKEMIDSAKSFSA